MAGSLTTTTFTGVQIGGDQNYDTRALLDATADGADVAVRVGTAVGSILTAPGVVGGAFSFQSNSANSMVLVLRSGLTVYQWWNTHAQTGA